tara:strand:- start:32 stop:661 length:630 start_codon:yes stop_codon:yes gene_type:complete
MINSINNIVWLLKNRKHFKNWKKRKFLPPSPEFIKHDILKSNTLENCLWIESGTYYGDTTNMLSKIAKKVISIEADERLSNLAKKKFERTKNIEIILGKSEDLLKNILIKNYIYRNVCIYLDAHLCQDHLINKKTFGNEETGTPIKIELNVIESEKNNFDNINLLIDDIRLFDINFQNYPSKNYLVDWCKKNNFKWEISHDIFVAKYIG